ncbi:hypothetical protein [Streptomyces erythrochromogenes]|uniref:hypothetical protein n=1 Tax=Streptomyces erythrochromogenes TaxID=285574 RepID=UPI003442E382
MSETHRLWPQAPSAETDWLTELCGDGTTGFEPPRRPDAVWVLNAMYEHESGPGGLSHHELRRAALAAGAIDPARLGNIDLEIGTATGGGLGRAEHPGPAYRRLRWAELSARCGDPMVPEGKYPSLRCFPSARRDGSWPVGIEPPTEGSLDRPTWDRLVDVLVAHSTQGPDTRALAYYNPLMLPAVDFDNLHVRTGRLGDAHALYDNPDADFSPSNLWPEDRSWILCTDYDLWATKVVGPEHLVEALLRDPVIEAVRLPWTS